MPVSADSVPPRRLSILFVEDNDYLREVTCALLERADREIVEAASAEEALARLAERPFDLLVTDVSLGQMSGIDLARRLLEVRPQAWVIVSSGYVLDTQALAGMGPHVRSLPKPFEADDMERLLTEIAASLDQPLVGL